MINKYLRWVLVADGVLALYTFLYAYIFHFDIMIKKVLPLYPITSFGILGIIFIYAGITGKINIVSRIIAGIAGVIVFVFPFIGADISGLFGSLLTTAAALPGFPFAGGLFIHVVFEHMLGGILGGILAVKPGLLLKKVLGVQSKKS